MAQFEFTKDSAFVAIAKISDAINRIDNNDPYIIKIEKKRKKRSKSANAYAWTLIDKLAEKTGIKKEEIYRDIIRNIGGNCYMAVVGTTRAGALINDWQEKGLGWVADIIEQNEDNTTLFLYQGSSVYDTAQMNRLISLLVQECEQNDIETLTPRELALLEY